MEKQEMIYGIQAVKEALVSGKEMERILVSKYQKNEGLQEIRSEAAKSHQPLSLVPDIKLEKLTKKNHQGVVAFLSPISYTSIDHVLSEVYAKGQDPFFLVLDQVTDVRNIGAIARSAEAMGVHALVVPIDNSARLGADAVKSSAGALLHLPIIREKVLNHSIHYLRRNGLRVVAITEKAENNLEAVDLKGPIALVMGSEEKGIALKIRAISDEEALIPMSGKIASLNVASATSIALYEACRQRTK